MIYHRDKGVSPVCPAFFSTLLSLLAFMSAAILFAQSPAPGRVELTVVDNMDLPVPHASVELSRNTPTDPSVRHATTDDDGRAVFPRVDPGQYRVTLVQAEGYRYDPPNPNETRPIDVAEGGTARPGKVAVLRLGAIEGTVVYESGEPIVGARVAAMQYTWYNGVRTLLSLGHAATTDKQGRYLISPINPGNYYVRVMGGEPPFAPVWYPNADRTSDALRVAVTPGGAWSSAGFRIRRSGTFHIRGAVIGVPDKASPRVLTVESCTNGVRELTPLLTAVTTKADGSFDADGLPPGRYCLTFEAGPKGDPVAYAEDIATVTDRDIENLRLSATLPFEIAGLVKAAEGESLSLPASVELMTANALGRPSLKADVDPKTGAFRFAGVLTTEYKLIVRTRPGQYTRLITFADRDISDGLFNPVPGGALGIEVATARGRLHGRIDLGERETSNGVSVTLAPDGPSASRTDLDRTIYADSKGEFSVTDLAPATYRIYAWEKFPNVLIRSPEFRDFFPSTPVQIDGETQQDIEIKLIPAALIDAAQASF